MGFYVDRDADGNITGAYGAAQHDGQEYVEGEVQLYRSPSTLALEKIIELEAKQTSRLVREAALGSAQALLMLQNIENQIAILRKEV